MLDFVLSLISPSDAPLLNSVKLSASQLLPYWGIICVGIGDAMAAIVGSKFGENNWLEACPENKRTIEGTFGGCISMLIFSGNSTAPLRAIRVIYNFSC